MKKFNLFNEIIVAKSEDLKKAVSSNKEFGITIDGEVVYDITPNHIYIYIGKAVPPTPNALSVPKPITIETLLGHNYKIVEDGERTLIKAGAAWQDILTYNIANASYDDSTGDGIAEFSDEILEDYGWYATDFAVNYRDMVDVIEKDVDGVLLCIEQEEPYQFSGLGFIHDIENARVKVKEYCINFIKDKLENDEDYVYESLDSDELEALEHFGLKR